MPRCLPFPGGLIGNAEHPQLPLAGGAFWLAVALARGPRD
jgi:hypothetical protein